MFEIGRPCVKYPESLLSSDETVLFDVHHHPVVLWWPVFLTFPFVALWITLLFTGSIFRGGAALIAGFAVLAALAGFLAWRALCRSHANLVLTNHRLIYCVGVFTRHSREIPIRAITDVSSSQLVLGRIFGYGDLVIESASEYQKAPYFNLPRPEELKLSILEQVRDTGEVAASDDISSVAEKVALAVTRVQPTQEIAALPPERPPLYSEIVDQIERLDRLRGKGSLSDEEFRKAKESLLDRLNKEQP